MLPFSDQVRFGYADPDEIIDLHDDRCTIDPCICVELAADEYIPDDLKSDCPCGRCPIINGKQAYYCYDD